MYPNGLPFAMVSVDYLCTFITMRGCTWVGEYECMGSSPDLAHSSCFFSPYLTFPARLCHVVALLTMWFNPIYLRTVFSVYHSSSILDGDLGYMIMNFGSCGSEDIIHTGKLHNDFVGKRVTTF